MGGICSVSSTCVLSDRAGIAIVDGNASMLTSLIEDVKDLLASRNALRISPADSKRSAGIFFSVRSIIFCNCFGIDAGNGSGSRVVIAAIRDAMSICENGKRPVSSW